MSKSLNRNYQFNQRTADVSRSLCLQISRGDCFVDPPWNFASNSRAIAHIPMHVQHDRVHLAPFRQSKLCQYARGPIQDCRYCIVLALTTESPSNTPNTSKLEPFTKVSLCLENAPLRCRPNPNIRNCRLCL